MHGGAKDSGAPPGERNGAYRHGRFTGSSLEAQKASGAALRVVGKGLHAMRNLITGTVFALALLVSAPGVAQDYVKGVDAYDRGDFATALKEWKPLAEKGDALAQSDLGDVYRLGKGVPQDYVEAMKWYRKAAEQGSEYSQNILGAMYGHGRRH